MATTTRIDWNRVLARYDRANVTNTSAEAICAEARDAYYAAVPKAEWADNVVPIHSAKVNRGVMNASEYIASLEAHLFSLKELIAATDALIDTPAPDLTATIRKLEIAIEHELDAGKLSPLLDDLRKHASQPI